MKINTNTKEVKSGFMDFFIFPRLLLISEEYRLLGQRWVQFKENSRLDFEK